MPGRPPKLLTLHKAHGTYRKDRHAKREGEFSVTPGQIGDPPDFIASDPVAMQEWRNCVEDQDFGPLLSAAFYSSLVEYCHLHSRMMADAKANGAKRKRMNGTERALFHGLRKELGRTLASQSKVKAPKAPEPQSKWAAL